jgi:hypothetical protein
MSNALWCAASLTVLGRPLVEGSLAPILWRWPKVLVPFFWWPIAIEISSMSQHGVAALTVIVARRSWSFV